MDDQAVDRGSVIGQLVDELPSQRRAALDGEAVEVALHRERHGTPGDGLHQPLHGGIAGLAGPALADLDHCLERAQPLHDRLLCAWWHEHQQATLRRAGHHCGRQGGVATGGDGQRRVGIDQAQRRGHRQAQHHTGEVARLVRARHVAGLILDPHAGPCLEAQLGIEAGRTHDRRGAESATIDGGDGLVELVHELDEPLVGPAGGAGHVPGVEAAAVAQERVGLAFGSRRPWPPDR